MCVLPLLLPSFSPLSRHSSQSPLSFFIHLFFSFFSFLLTTALLSSCFLKAYPRFLFCNYSAFSSSPSSSDPPPSPFVAQGRLQRNSILEKLDVLQSVVKRVKWNQRSGEEEKSEGEEGEVQKLGHLHIALRDWLSSETPEDIRQILTSPETPNEGEALPDDAVRRNSIRERVLSTFSSVHVWLLPPPRTTTAALGKDIGLGELSRPYAKKITEMRKIMAEQLTEPLTFQGRVSVNLCLP